ncbi:glycosyltransferase family 4 protein [Arthrobacter sp. NPDC055138]
MKILFLAHNIYGIGGTVRTVINLAEALAERHEVEIASVFRRTDETKLPVSRKIRITGIVDTRPGVPKNHRDDPRKYDPSSKVPPSEEFYGQYSRLTDELTEQFLRRTTAEVIIGTRPSLNLLVAQFAPSKAVRIAQEHMSHLTIPEGTRDAMRTWYPRMDAAITVTEADAQRFRDTTPIADLIVGSIPNSVPAPRIDPSTHTNKVIVSAGRLDPVKRYDLLIHAYHRLHMADPSWTLRIYGSGREHASLQRLINELGLAGRAFLMGSSSSLESEWAKCSVAVSSSDRESFGMTIVEAMRAGLPVISTDCPDGPREIIQDGRDGFLVPVNDVDALTEKLAALTGSEDLRKAMGSAAFERSQRFDPKVVASSYEELFHTLAVNRSFPSRRLRAQIKRAESASLDPQTLDAHHLQFEQLARLTARIKRKMDVAANHPSTPWGKKNRARVETRLAECVLLNRDSSQIKVRDLASGWQDTWLIFQMRKKNQRPLRLRMTESRDVPGTYSVRFPIQTIASNGHWDLSAEQRGRKIRLIAGLRDTRHLLSTVDLGQTSHITHAIPYAAKDGLLAIRSWSKRRHAEVSQISVSGEAISIRGSTNAPLSSATQCSVRLSLRQHENRTLYLPIRVTSDHEFEFEVSIDQLVAKRLSTHDDWDAHLMLGETSIRIAKILDDIAERKTVEVYPHVCVRPEVTESARDLPVRRVDVRPYYSLRNELSLSVVER